MALVSFQRLWASILLFDKGRVAGFAVEDTDKFHTVTMLQS